MDTPLQSELLKGKLRCCNAIATSQVFQSLFLPLFHIFNFVMHSTFKYFLVNSTYTVILNLSSCAPALVAQLS
jgi:hypothetical protein